MAKTMTAAKSDSDYRTESDLRTLIEAEKIKRDKTRLKAALSLRDKMKTHMESIDG